MFNIQEYCESQIRSENRQINNFRDNLSNDPFHAMEWSEMAFTAAARIKVMTIVLTWVKEGHSLEEIEREANKMVVAQAASLSDSTSVPANHLEKKMARAWANLASELKFEVKLREERS